MRNLTTTLLGMVACLGLAAGCGSKNTGGPGNNNNTPTCGDGVAQGAELCDGADLRGADCASIGLGGGTLVCNSVCSFDAVGCTIQATCGNGLLEFPEECDDGAANSDTDMDACRNDCQLAGCGDAVLDTGEECDDGNLDDTDGCTAACAIANAYPTCTILTPSDGEAAPFDTQWSLTANASDPEDGPLTGTSVEWFSDVLGSLGTGLSLDVTFDPPYDHVITCVATDSDGATGESTVTIDAYSPYVEIWHPGPNDGPRPVCDATTNQPVPWRGVAFDYEDGDISTDLTWESDLEGAFINSGEQFNECLYTVGTHLITATVVDSDSNSASATRIVPIVP